MTDLIRDNVSEEKIIDAINTWAPLPDILFFCDITPDEAYKRRGKSKSQDEFDDYQSLKEYYDLYQRALEFVASHNLVKVVRLDTTKSIIDSVSEIRKELDKYFR